MKEHSLILQGWGVRSSLDGRKTMTRRIPGIMNSTVDGSRVSSKRWANLDFSKAWIDPGGSIFGRGPYLKVPTFDGETTHRVRCLYEPGDVLWVRETWQSVVSRDDLPARPLYVREPTAEGARILYKEKHDDGLTEQGFPWRPSIHMPRWACRLLLTVTDVRVERVQDMPEEDARAEGVADHVLWDSINAKRGYSWESNPWVWVVSFAKREGADTR